MTARIYHNPKCSTSRKTLELLRDNGVEPEVVLYLKNPPSRAELKTLIADAGIDVDAAIDDAVAFDFAAAGLDEDEDDNNDNANTTNKSLRLLAQHHALTTPPVKMYLFPLVWFSGFLICVVLYLSLIHI